MKTIPPQITIPQHLQVRNYFQEFKMINHQNQELIRLADSISKSSFMHPSYPPIIAQTEQQLRRNLSIFVDSIRDFFLDIDHRLRALAQAFEQDTMKRQQEAARNRTKTKNQQQSFIRQQHANQNIVLKINQMTDPYQIFSQKITVLETSLRRTQQNEAKLLEIVQKLSKKSEKLGLLSQQSSSTFPRPELHQDFVRRPSKNTLKDEKNHQNSFRLFALRTNFNNERKDIIYVNNPRSISFSPITFTSNQQFRSQQFYHKPQAHTIYDSSIDHKHRANFLMKTLAS